MQWLLLRNQTQDLALPAGQRWRLHPTACAQCPSLLRALPAASAGSQGLAGLASANSLSKFQCWSARWDSAALCTPTVPHFCDAGEVYEEAEGSYRGCFSFQESCLFRSCDNYCSLAILKKNLSAVKVLYIIWATGKAEVNAHPPLKPQLSQGSYKTQRRQNWVLSSWEHLSCACLGKQALSFWALEHGS